MKFNLYTWESIRIAVSLIGVAGIINLLIGAIIHDSPLMIGSGIFALIGIVGTILLVRINPVDPNF